VKPTIYMRASLVTFNSSF